MLRRLQRLNSFIEIFVEDRLAQPGIESLWRADNHLFEERRRFTVALLRQEDAPSPEQLLDIVDGSSGRRCRRSVRLDSQHLQEGESGYRLRQRLLAFSLNGREIACERPFYLIVDRGSRDTEEQPSGIAARLKNSPSAHLTNLWRGQRSRREDDEKGRAVAECRVGGLRKTSIL
jgi:hypothetical protein